MILLSPDQRSVLQDWFTPESIYCNIAPHIIQTSHGACFVDRWPHPRVLLADVARNCRLYGDSTFLPALDIPLDFAAMLYAPASFDTALQAIWPHPPRWDRVSYELPAAPRVVDAPDAEIRRLTPADSHHLWGLSHHSDWIAKTWGGAAGLAASGRAWGAIVEDRLVAVANVFFQGSTYEDIGIVTEPAFRGQGLGPACVSRLCQDICARNHIPTWNTSPDNIGSIRVAEKVGFEYRGDHKLYVLNMSIPAVPNNEKKGSK